MPQRKSPVSLYQLCLADISKNMKYWTKYYEDIYLKRSDREKAKILYILGPFDDLSAPIAEGLLQQLTSNKSLTTASLHLLINGGTITKLDLQSCPKLVNDEVILKVAQKCPRIRHLNVQKCQRISSAAFATLSTCLPNAISLNFSSTNIRGVAVHTLYDKCLYLQELLLQKCQINNHDLHMLCKVSSDKGPLRLRHIDLIGTMVTEEGVKEVLHYLPYLCEVQFGSLLNALHEASVFSPVISPEMEVRGMDLGHKFCLQTLQCSDFMSISDQDLELIINCCPFVTKVDLRFAVGLTTSGLLQLIKLDNLQELRLGVDGSRSISYESSLKPLLKSRGSNIITLTLQDFQGVNIVEILQFCPNLRKLLIFMIELGSLFGDNIPRPDLPPLTLQELHIWNKIGDTTLNEGILETVLSKAHSLQTLGLIRVDSFNDFVFAQTLKQNQFLKLSTFSLNECNSISGQALTPFILNSRNALKDVKLMNNWQVNLADFKSWEKICLEGNYDIKLEWT